MATFDYQEMADTASELLNEFGNPITLKKPDGEPVYNPKTRITEQKYKSYSGIAVMKTYTADVIGDTSSVIQAGDVEFKCQMNIPTIVPTESKDKVVFGGVTYNVITVATSNPSGALILIHTLQCRKAS